MREGPDIARIASLVGDPARANMLNALMGGTALTASELALEAGVSLPTASSHLSKLMEGGLLTLASQGRHRYYGLASAQ
ncbi:ArsR family transcriptional regulator, partial [Mesorhizobium sp. M2A.F.Ca.ET.046.02.1.1]